MERIVVGIAGNLWQSDSWCADLILHLGLWCGLRCLGLDGLGSACRSVGMQVVALLALGQGSRRSLVTLRALSLQLCVGHEFWQKMMDLLKD